ncbi:CheW protein [Thalassoporum mexicanum PCC 7367]|uniref:chemotaxis protein CheW n=1 Tax=Thalassoporum mexicanum TaxID=3457544 RepID=UPI00029F8611|nr:chemotaxis protein CheW [Pseudanabaena sp. PCC 7367]AFY71605.1 CheW protein [Pseudanabaena sp. PCC 7367]
MLMLIFQAGDERYALATDQVVEVVPMVILRQLRHAPDYIAGAFNYQGQVVPVLDLNYLLNGANSRPFLSTRIILTNFANHEGDRHILGLMAERVTQTIELAETDLVDAGYHTLDTPYLGKMTLSQTDMIQCIQVEQLLPLVAKDNLFLALEGSKVD